MEELENPEAWREGGREEETAELLLKGVLGTEEEEEDTEEGGEKNSSAVGSVEFRGEPRSRARPKSPILIEPSKEMKMLEGLMSRC